MPRTLSELYGQDSESESGKWIILRPEQGKAGDPSYMPALEVKLRSVHSRVVRREEQKLDRKYRVQIIAGNGFLDPDTQDEKDVLLVSRAVLVDWRGFQDDAGAALEFKPKVVQDTLTEFAQLRRELLILARIDENFRSAAQVDTERSELAKNL